MLTTQILFVFVPLLQSDTLPQQSKMKTLVLIGQEQLDPDCCGIVQLVLFEVDQTGH